MLGHLPEWNRLGLYAYNWHATTSYVAEMTNPNFDVWRPKYSWLGKECSKCKPYTNTWDTKVLHVCCASVPESPNFQFVLLYRQPFWVTGHFETIVYQMTPNDLEHYKFKGIPYILYKCS